MRVLDSVASTVTSTNLLVIALGMQLVLFVVTIKRMVIYLWTDP